ncbi:hypothetical protein A3K71_04635 [archaeon RBG_16_50_20]|nr:MAG: hypothetical protein A3K71_04635 [archaeon RBG_16_50_20]
MKVLVLDTSALIMGLDPLGLELESFSVPEVTEELRDQTGPSYRLAISASSGKLRIRSPTPDSLKEISDKARTLGDKIALSNADASVLALALDLLKEGKTPVIVTDDYAVQNVAEGLGIAYQSLATLGIRQKFDWIFYCPACFRRYPGTGDLEVCQVCGTKLKRKPLRKESAKSRYSKPS